MEKEAIQAMSERVISLAGARWQVLGCHTVRHQLLLPDSDPMKPLTVQTMLATKRRAPGTCVSKKAFTI
jgi:hypothetical protein